MKPTPGSPASMTQVASRDVAAAGEYTMANLRAITAAIDTLAAPAQGSVSVDGSAIGALDSAGALTLRRIVGRLQCRGAVVTMKGMNPRHASLLEAADANASEQARSPRPAPPAAPTHLAGVGNAAIAWGSQAIDLLAFAGETALAFRSWVAHPLRIRWRAILLEIRRAGVDALPIVGLLSFLLGIVIAYQGADQLRQYGANIFIADLVGLSMLREFAPLMTAIIIAGRSGSAHAAQIGTMKISEEIDAMRTLGIAPLDLLVLPKVVALLVALPLLTVFADVLGVSGGMIMAFAQLDVGPVEFLDRFVTAVSATAYFAGLVKTPVFALVIVTIGCFQGFRTEGGADSVGRQTTRSVVQAIFLVIVADALFSIAFSMLDI